MTTVNRRDFLIQSVSAAVAAGGLYPRKASGAAAKDRLSVAVIGCGRLGQHYAEIYRALPQTDLVAIAEWNPERRKVVGERFGVKALYRDAEAMLKEVVPDLAAIITPTKYMTGAVIALCRGGSQGSPDRPALCGQACRCRPDGRDLQAARDGAGGRRAGAVQLGGGGGRETTGVGRTGEAPGSSRPQLPRRNPGRWNGPDPGSGALRPGPGGRADRLGKPARGSRRCRHRLWD